MKIALPTLLLLSPLGLGQGMDDCASATPIVGVGPHAFDNSTATTDGLADPLCLAFGSDQVETDVWFQWTAGSTGTVVLSFCGQTSVDTKVAVYDGISCGSSTMLSCNDDSCGLQSELSFNAVTGQQYLIRVGTYPGAAGGAGTFTLTDLTPIVNPNNGHAYLLVNGGTDWDSAKLAAEGMSFGGLTGHLVTINDQAELDWMLANLGFDRPWIGLYQNTSSSSYAEPAGGWEWVTGEPFTFSNWAAGEPNDNPVGENTAEMFASGEWNDILPANSWTNSYIVEFDGAGGPSLFCSPAAVNSTGQSVTLASSDVSGTGVFHLEAEGGPFDQFAMFLVAAGNTTPGIPVGSGNLCLLAPIGRYGSTAGPGLNSIGKFDAAGVLQNLFGTSSVGSGFDVPAVLPSPPGGVISMGQTWHFQLWYRDTGSTSNFSDGISVLF